MQMTPLTKWCGFSCALHLAFASVVVLMVSREAQRPHKVVMVTLDFVPALDSPLPLETRDRVKAVVRTAPTVTPDRPVVDRAVAHKVPGPAANSPEPSLSEPVPLPPPPVPSAGAAATRPAGTDQAREPREQKQPVMGAPVSAPSANAQPARTVQRAAAEQRPAAEIVQQRYLKENFTYIRDLITKQLVYPPMARRMNWSGKAMVSFIIVEDGSVHSVRVIQSSGYPLLDKSALETVRQAAPFPKPPTRAEIVVPINFKMW
jgi:periplasmic protein TonB